MTTVLNHSHASVYIEESGDRKHRISVAHTGDLFIPVRTWETAYSLDLIEHVLRVKGPAYLCDEIMRDEDPLYVQHSFFWGILSYMEEKAFAGQRVLDFGSGSGSSSMVLARMLPSTVK